MGTKMNGSAVDRISEIRETNKDEVLDELRRALFDSPCGILSVKSARDNFSKILTRVRGGEVQLIGHKLEDQTVIISLKDLAGLIASCSKMQSFGSALDDIGFKPIGRRITISAAVNHLPLKPTTIDTESASRPSI